MLRDSSNIRKAFQFNIEKSERECKKELEEIRDLSFNLSYCFGTFLNEENLTEVMDSLVFWCFIETTEITGYTLYLSYCGLYRNAFENIRHILESIVQAYYIDLNHPNTSFETKMEILKEIEDKKEYHASKLINEKLSFKNEVCEGLDCKGFLKVSYKNLSQMVHPSHQKIIATRKDAMSSGNKDLSELIDCGEVAKISESLRTVLDIFYVLVTFEFPIFANKMREDKDFVDCVKKYKLKLLDKIIRSKSK